MPETVLKFDPQTVDMMSNAIQESLRFDFTAHMIGFVAIFVTASILALLGFRCDKRDEPELRFVFLSISAVLFFVSIFPALVLAQIYVAPQSYIVDKLSGGK